MLAIGQALAFDYNTESGVDANTSESAVDVLNVIPDSLYNVTDQDTTHTAKVSNLMNTLSGLFGIVWILDRP